MLYWIHLHFLKIIFSQIFSTSWSWMFHFFSEICVFPFLLHNCFYRFIRYKNWFFYRTDDWVRLTLLLIGLNFRRFLIYQNVFFLTALWIIIKSLTRVKETPWLLSVNRIERYSFLKRCAEGLWKVIMSALWLAFLFLT